MAAGRMINPALLRMQNLFPTGQDPSMQPMQSMDQPMQDQGMDPDAMINQRMRSIYQPENAASDRLTSLLGQYPQHEKPSLLRKIGASIISVGQGPEAGMEALNRPFNEKLTDWKNQVGPAYQAAQIERGDNTNERTFAYQSAANDIRKQLADAKIENDQAKLSVAQDRAEVYRMKAESPDWDFDAKGPYVIKTNPKTGEVVTTGIKTGSMTDEDKINLQTKGRIQNTQVAGAEARKTEETRQSGRESLSETRGWKVGTIPDPNDSTKQIGVRYNEITGEVHPVTFEGKGIGGVNKTGATGGKPELPTQTKVRQYNQARTAYNEHPEWQKWIALDRPGSNDFQLKPPSTGWFSSGPEMSEYKRMFQFIYGRPMDQEDMTTPESTNTNTNTGGNDKRNRAIQILSDAKKPMTEANIAHIMGQLK